MTDLVQNPSVSSIDLVSLVGGIPKTTSLIVAEKFEKNHFDVLRAIKNLECSPEFNQRNFAGVDYEDAKGERRPMVEMTRDGFTFLAMGFTGKEAAKWKESYIDAFNQMEAALRAPQSAPSHIAPHRAIGFDSPEKRRTRRHPCGFFCARRLPPSFMGGSGGEPSGSPVPFPGLSTRLTARPRLTAWRAETKTA